MARRYYSSTAVATTLSASANNSTTSITVTALSGYPAQTPFTAIIDPDTASEEVVEVTNVAGTTLTVTRGVDGTSAVSHNAGAVFRHGVSGRDFDEANAFVNGGGVSNSLISASKGALITSTGSAVDDLTVGTDGHVLTADSNETLGIKWAAPAGGLPTQTSQEGKILTTNGTAASWVDPPTNRNLIINGAMQVHQRGTSVTGITSVGYYTADRWRTAGVGTTQGTWTQSVESDAPTGSGLRKSLKMLCTTAAAAPSASGLTQMEYRFEGQDLQRVKKGTSSAEQLTLSFWVKSNVTGTYIAELTDGDNSRHVAASYTVSASGTWERKTITLPADTTGALDNDNAASASIYFYLVAGTDYTSGTLATTWASTTTANRAVGQTNVAAATNNYWQITGVQLETGPVATPFEFEPYEATLRKCQRYYVRFVGDAGNDILSGLGWAPQTNSAHILFPLPVEMRIQPHTVESSAVELTDLVNEISAGTLTLSANTTALIGQVNCSTSGLTQMRPYVIRNDNNAAGHVSFSAEL